MNVIWIVIWINNPLFIQVIQSKFNNKLLTENCIKKDWQFNNLINYIHILNLKLLQLFKKKQIDNHISHLLNITVKKRRRRNEKESKKI